MTRTKNKPKKSKKTPPKKKKKSLFLKGLKWLFVLGIWGGIFLTAILMWYAKDLPDITQSATFERRASIIIQAEDGSTLARYGEAKGKNINADTVPKHLVHAILATEDRRFYSHFGIDPLGITRAMVINVYKGRFAQGGSTITQQLAKNLFLTHKRELSRKIQEALLAVWLEQELSKNEILSAYMNRVYLGSGTYGFEAAAQLYFNKSAENVTLKEAALLAGLLKAPSKYSPHHNKEAANKRANVVLTAMHNAGYLTKTAMQAAQKSSLLLPHKASNRKDNARYFTDWVVNGLNDIVGISDTDIIIETTFNTTLQAKAQSALEQGISDTEELQFVSQGAVLAMAPDGAIKVMVGGRSYNESQFNRTVLAKRSPGSAFKPIVFLSALEQGKKPRSKILDSPLTKGEYRPKNFAENYFGKVDYETALAKSLNTATVRIAQDVGIDKIRKTARKIGILSPLQRDLSIALGSSGISMLELTTAYTTLANGGYKVFPYAIKRIRTQNGDVLFERNKNINHQQIVKSKHIKDINFMMQSVINNGTGKAAKIGYPAHGKTGTSQNSRDAWFAGYTSHLTTIVWLGNDDNSPMRRVTGSGLPAQIWKEVMIQAHKNKTPPTKLTKTSEVSANKKGFTNLLNRLLPGAGSTRPPTPKRKNDYSHLND